jgi:hypothetical protein
LGQYPTTSTFIGVLGLLIASFPLHFGSRKSHLFRFSLPLLAIGISASLFIHFHSFITASQPRLQSTFYYTVSPIICYLHLFFHPISVFDIL